MTDTHDLIIVGGGIGGSALACVMAEAGYSVLVLEESQVFVDRVRGEWIAPWGVVETRRVGLYDLLVAAGGHHLKRHVTYDETREPTEAEATALPLDAILPDIPGPLCIGHPHHCQTLYDEAGRRGAVTRRGVTVEEVVPGPEPRVTYVQDGTRRTATSRLLVGADGRQSMVRKACGIALIADAPHHMFAGLLVDGAPGWEQNTQAIGTEGDFAFLTFPQGGGRVRVYGSYPLSQRGRFSGPDGARKFLDAFRMACSPENHHIAGAEPAGPLYSFFNASARAETPIAEGVVLIGDAAGYNDPIVGQGLSITYRDVRTVSELLKGSADWSSALFAPYVEERAERMRRLRIAAMISSAVDAEFGADAQARRRAFHEQAATDPTFQVHFMAVMAGPEVPPAELFTDAHVERMLGVARQSA
jgi:2-polyprenyl-6-methoxyphenol hydroxylase-like FAD-dependent oxidoreductase